MNLNTHIIREALGLPATPWSKQQLTQLDISHVELLTEDALGSLDPATLYLVGLESRALLQAADAHAHICVVCAKDAPPELVPGNPKGTWAVVDEGGVPSVLNRITRLFAHYDEWDRALVQASFVEGGIDSYLEIGQQAIGAPICLLGLDLTLLGISSMEFEHTGTYWRYYDGMGYLPMDVQAQDNFDLSFVDEAFSGRMTQGSYPSDPKHSYLDVAIMKDGTVSQWLSVVGPILGFSCAQASLVRWFRDRLEDSVVISTAEARNTSPIVSLVQDLLDGVEVDDLAFRRRLASRGFSRYDHFVVVRFQQMGSTHNRMFRRMMLAQHLQATMPDAVLVERADEHYIVLNFKEREQVPPELMKHLRELSESLGCLCTVSAMTGDFGEIAHCFAQADVAAELLPAASPQVRTFEESFGKLATATLLEMFPIQQLCHPVVLSLASDSEGYGGDLVACLQAYLELDGNVTGVAERLMTHRNTVRYRMRKIEEHLGKPLEGLGASERMQLLMSCWMVAGESS